MSRRWLAMAGAAAVMIVVAAAQQKPKMSPHVFRLSLGLKDENPRDWSGQVEVAGGELVKIEAERFEAKDALIGPNSWRCSTHDYIAPGQRIVVEIPDKKQPPPPMVPWPQVVNLEIRGENPEITVRTPKGSFQFAAADIRLGGPKRFLSDEVQVERVPEAAGFRASADASAPQPDYPAYWVRYRTNRHYLTWVSYQRGKDRVLLAERDGPDGAWSEPVEVSGLGDHFRVAMASTHLNHLWVVWASQVKGNWDLYGREYDIGAWPAKPLSAEVRLTESPGPDIWHRMTTDEKGRAWLVWQGFRAGQADIFARCADERGWQAPVKVSESPANDWDPAIVADTRDDRVWIAWDTYDLGSYDIRVRGISGGPEGKLSRSEAISSQLGNTFNAHPSLACTPAGDLYVAWDESGYNWGKDTGWLYQDSPGTRLYQTRAIRLARRDRGSASPWQQVDEGFRAALPPDMQEFNELPQLQCDSEGTLWMAFRHRTCRRPRNDGWGAQGRWDVYAAAYRDGQWTAAPIPLLHSGGRNDMRISSQRDNDGNVFFAFATDNRTWTPPAMTERNLGITVSRVSGQPALMTRAKPQEAEIIDKNKKGQGGQALAPSIAAPPVPVHPREREQVARIRGYEIKQGTRTYKIYRGDLHRHTDISGDGVGDGSIMDLHRYGLDAAAFDFILIADHNMGNDREYAWWRTQKANDLYTVPGRFISMYGYERSVRYPNGHRNVIWPERGQRTLPLPQQAIPAQMAADTGKLYAYLRETNGICTAHTSATEQGTDWKDFDATLEPIVELFQGFHTSYEMEGAPLAIDAKTGIVHQGFRPDGFITKALDKGYRLGFQASSDHVSTHVSYACVLAEEFSRKGLIDAMQKRHAYAATDNIILDVRSGVSAVMGDEIRSNHPELTVAAIGTGPIERVDIIRNGKVVHSARPGPEPDRVHFAWKDPTPEKGKTSYYYVRVLQTDRHMAWASPVWVQVE